MKIGIIGLDNSHALHYPRLIALAAQSMGEEITFPIASKAGSLNIPQSCERVDDIAIQVSQDTGCVLSEHIESVAESSDGLLILALDPQIKQAAVERTLPYGKPLFIDKYLAANTTQAKLLVQQARAQGTPLFSASALPFHPALLAFAQSGEPHKPHDIQMRGPLYKIAGLSPRLFYGFHYTGMAAALFHTDCRAIRVREHENGLSISGEWRDGGKLLVDARADDYGPFRLANEVAGIRAEIAGDNPTALYSGVAEAIASFFFNGPPSNAVEQAMRALAWLEGRPTPEE